MPSFQVNCKALHLIQTPGFQSLLRMARAVDPSSRRPSSQRDLVSSCLHVRSIFTREQGTSPSVSVQTAVLTPTVCTSLQEQSLNFQRNHCKECISFTKEVRFRSTHAVHVINRIMMQLSNWPVIWIYSRMRFTF